MSSTSIYFSFVKDGDNGVDTPCSIKLDVLPALEQDKVISRKEKVTCNVT